MPQHIEPTRYIYVQEVQERMKRTRRAVNRKWMSTPGTRTHSTEQASMVRRMRLFRIEQTIRRPETVKSSPTSSTELPGVLRIRVHEQQVPIFLWPRTVNRDEAF